MTDDFDCGGFVVQPEDRDAILAAVDSGFPLRCQSVRIPIPDGVDTVVYFGLDGNPHEFNVKDETP